MQAQTTRLQHSRGGLRNRTHLNRAEIHWTTAALCFRPQPAERQCRWIGPLDLGCGEAAAADAAHSAGAPNAGVARRARIRACTTNVISAPRTSMAAMN